MTSINNFGNLQINRGVELILRNRRENKLSKTKQKKFSFCKKISLFKREIIISFSFDIVKIE